MEHDGMLQHNLNLNLEELWRIYWWQINEMGYLNVLLAIKSACNAREGLL